uniref:Uncharacterized protein n=1 Tax=Chromulina nebulosa TaxID=96789 RepID=A0A7S0XEL1_9STRA|mmetsp:Transcript_1885/g.1689  ORF Transcript_1885/g.1689 Transcript_1885/m.1689 type:complete len:848 (+) Transcript_1885:20-2563(+)
MNKDFDEPLSLLTFEPTLAFPPYLNTPRSLEACHRNGVNPIELVAIPYEEFLKNSNNDPYIAQIRYEKIDGLRKATLDKVLQEWKRLVDSNWIDSNNNNDNVIVSSDKESILHVPSSAHSTLLEIQASKFRKIELEEWKSFQHLLNIEIKNANKSNKNTTIVKEHNDWNEKNKQLQKLNQIKRQQLHREQYEAKQRYEEAKLNELKQIKLNELKEENELKMNVIMKMKKDRKAREYREQEQLQREQYAKKMKNEILNNIEAKIKARKFAQELRQQEIESRLQEAKEKKRNDDEIKRKIENDHLLKIKQDAIRNEEIKRKQLAERIAEDMKKREKILNDRKNEKREIFSTDNLKEKLQLSKERNENIIREKSEKILRQLELKESICKDELDKIKQYQDKRKDIKNIREEAFALASMRRKKAEEHRLNQLNQSIKLKEERADAIKKGYSTLTHMTGAMRAIMSRAIAELKEEMKHLHDKEAISPDKVIERAMKISDSLLFPTLDKTFNIQDETTRPNTTLVNESISNNLSNRPSTVPNDYNYNRVNSQRNERKDKSPDNILKSNKKEFIPLGREITPTLPIKAFNKNNLLVALQESKVRAEAPPPSWLPTTSSSRSNRQTAHKTVKTNEKPLTSTSNNNNSNTYDSGFDSSFPYIETNSYSSNNQTISELDNNILPEVTTSYSYTPDSRKDIKSNNKSKIDKYSMFRREFSSDHPLAGGKGKYEVEKSNGLIPNTAAKYKLPMTLNEKYEKLTIQSKKLNINNNNNLMNELNKKHQFELLQLLDKEKENENKRLEYYNMLSDDQERKKLQLIFNEERRIASENIINLTKQHENEMKRAMLDIMNLNNEI